MPYSCNMLPADGQTPRNGPKPDGILLSRTEGARAPSLVERSEYAVALTFATRPERRLTPGEEWHNMHNPRNPSPSPEVSLS